MPRTSSFVIACLLGLAYLSPRPAPALIVDYVCGQMLRAPMERSLRRWSKRNGRSACPRDPRWLALRMLNLKVPAGYRPAWRFFQVGLFLAGLAQPLIAQSPTVPFDAYPVHLADDEFELVYAPLHTYLRVGEHTYDYMITAMRRDVADEYESGGTERFRFRVGPLEVEHLRRFLEREVGNRGFYYLYPEVGTDCLSNLARAMARTTSIRIPDGINRSPTLTEAYLKSLRWGNDKRMETIVFREGTSGEKRTYNPWVLGDAAIASLMFVDNLIWSQVDRLPDGWTVHRADR